MTPRIPLLADLRAERFLHKRMGADAHAAFSARGWVDVPIPAGTYRTVIGQHTFARAALRITVAAKVFVVSQDDGHAIGTCCVYAVGGIDELLLLDRPRLPGLPVADQIYALWWLACHAPRHLLAQSNYIPMRVPVVVATTTITITTSGTGHGGGIYGATVTVNGWQVNWPPRGGGA